jgi:tetratricopeptide (TPR) repeat protein
MNIRRSHACILLALIFLLGVGLRYRMSSKITSSFEDLTIQPFSKESASHYRYAKMIAEGQPVPDLDTQAQYPEGLKVTNDSILEEYVVGYLYRFLPLKNIPFNQFVAWFVMLFSSMSILAVYHMSRAYTKNRLTGILAALFYTVSLPSILRNVGTEFAREHFALPFIFFHASFFVRAIDLRSPSKSRLVNAICSGACLFVALSSWKLCRFYLLIFAGFVLLNFVLRKDFRPYRLPLIVSLSFTLLAGVVVPHLRADLFLTSVPMILFYGLLVLGLIDRFVRPITFPLLRLGLMAGACGIFYLVLPHTERFGHVYYTTIYQLRFLFRHPSDPSRLPPVARLYWVPGYTHPSLYNFSAYFTVPLLAGAYGVGRSVKNLFRRTGSMGDQFLLYCCLATLVSYLFFSRLHVFFIFFLAVCIGRSIDLMLKRSKLKVLVYGVVALLCLHQVGQAVGNWDPLRVLRTLKIQPVQEEMFLENIANISDLVEWTQRHTPVESVMLSYWHISALVLAYADRATVLHTFFEDAGMRHKIIRFASVMYEDEEDFYQYCQQYGVNYFIYSARFHLDYSIVGTRFLADRLNIRPHSFVFNAHFFPERLRRFGLRYQNDCFRVYEVLQGNISKTDSNVDYQSIFDPRYAVAEVEKVKRFGEEISLAYFFYYSGVENIRQNRDRAALELLQRSISICPSLTNAWTLIATIFEEQGYTAEAIKAYQQALQFNATGPSAVEVRAALERLYAPIFGTYTFLGSNDADIDSTFTDASLHFRGDSTFTLSNPGFEDQNGQQFSIVETGTYTVADSAITFDIRRQEPAGFDYYYLFAAGENVLLVRLDQEHLTLRGAAPSGGLITLRWQR